MSKANEAPVEPPGRVLVVDSDQTLHSMLEDAVRDLGHEFVAHSSPGDGIAALDGLRPDVVILGIEDMPADAVRLARLIGSKRGIDLIAITDPSVVPVPEAKRLGAFDILTRPLDDTALVTASIDRVFEKRVLESELRQAREGSLLAEVAQVIGSSLDIGQVYETFVDRVRRLIPSDRVSIGVTDSDGSTTTSIYAWGVDLPEVRPGDVTANPVEPFTRGSHRAGIIQASAPENSEDDLPNLSASRRAGLRSFLTLPLVYQRRTVGSLGLRSRSEDAYTRHHLELAEQMALLIAPAVANAQLYGDLKETQDQLQEAHDELEQRVERRTAELVASEMSQRRLAEENQVVADLGRIMSSSLDIEEVYDVFVERMIKNLIPSDAVSINLIDAESGAFLTAYRRGPVGVLEGLGSPGSLVGSISEKVVESRAPVVVSETETGDMVSRYPRLAAQLEAGMRSFLVVPLIFKDEVFGTIAFDSTKAGNYSDPEVRLAQGIATQISGAVVSSQLYRDLRQTRDELQRLLAASPAMIFRATADGEYTTMFISDNVETVLGLEPRGIVEDPGMWTRRIHPQDRLKLSDEVVPALFDRGEAASEYRFLDARGSYRWLFERVELLHDGDGKPLEVVGSVVDITEIKEAQLELQESEERYRTLFEQSQDAITISDVDRQVHRREPVVLGPGGPF